MHFTRLARHFVLMVAIAGTLASLGAKADHHWSEKVFPAAILIGGIGCAAYEWSVGEYPLAAASLALSGMLSYGVNTFSRWCHRPEGPTLKEALSNPADEAEFSSPDELVQYFYKAFKETSEFAVADAVSFRGNIAEGRVDEIMERVKRVGVLANEQIAKTQNATLANSLLVAKEADQKKGMLEKIAKNVAISKSGICTTFAGLAYHLLTRGGKEKKIRVEVISRQESGGKTAAQASTHLFNIIGRAEDSEITDPTTWGSQTRIVDLWLGALGNAIVYKSNSPDYQGWFKNLKVVHSNK